jgi:murein L,D-transpeptidase YafK
MKLTFLAMVLAGALALTGCSPKTYTYDGPEVTRILVYKDSRTMYLMHHDTPLKVVNIDLGFEPRGHKEREGDGRTPVGDYIIDRRNPQSSFHLSLGISYPNAEDMARAQILGVEPGGDIFIHGQPNGPRRVLNRDWTAGCIAVTDEEMRQIYAMVRTGTPISLIEGSAAPVATVQAIVDTDPQSPDRLIRIQEQERARRAGP